MMLLLSIRPQYAEAIIHGCKTAELRRIRPKVASGQWALMYVSAPVKAIVGGLLIRELITQPVDDLWVRVGRNAGIDREQFDCYFQGLEFANALVIQEVHRLPIPLSLTTLREIWPTFCPPQSYRYLREQELGALSSFLWRTPMQQDGAFEMLQRTGDVMGNCPLPTGEISAAREQREVGAWNSAGSR